MGTTWSAQIVGPPEDIEGRLNAVLAGVIASMSQWDPASALSRFNRSDPGTWCDLPPDLLHVYNAALSIHRRTGGAFDPAQGALTELWGFGTAGPRSGMPSDAAIEAARPTSGASTIERNGARMRRVAPVQLDLSGIAKGYAVDALADCLRDAGAGDFLVEIGGEWVGRGIRPDGQPWWVDLESPPTVPLAPFRIALHNIAVATSGDYRRYFTEEGRRLGHTIDPRTGRPVDNGVVSVSVIAADCMTADGWATALTVLGPVDGLAMAEREGLAARIVTADGCEVLSPALLAMLD
jgi:thiamine biosynthesis lipoprotein